MARGAGAEDALGHVGSPPAFPFSPSPYFCQPAASNNKTRGPPLYASCLFIKVQAGLSLPTAVLDRTTERTGRGGAPGHRATPQLSHSRLPRDAARGRLGGRRPVALRARGRVQALETQRGEAGPPQREGMVLRPWRPGQRKSASCCGRMWSPGPRQGLNREERHPRRPGPPWTGASTWARLRAGDGAGGPESPSPSPARADAGLAPLVPRPWRQGCGPEGGECAGLQASRPSVPPGAAQPWSPSGGSGRASTTPFLESESPTHCHRLWLKVAFGVEAGTVPGSRQDTSYTVI